MTKETYGYRKVRSYRSEDLSGFFVYTAFCPVNDQEVLVKVGISSIPYDRLATIYCNSPYPVVLAFFCQIGRKKTALSVERAILNSFSEFKTRGEWLKLSTDAATKKTFSTVCNHVVFTHIHAKAEWVKATGDQIRIAMSTKLGETFTKGPV